jgi:hypothetical protein
VPHFFNGLIGSKGKKHVEPVVADALPNATFGHRLISFTSWCHYGLGVTLDQPIDIRQFHLQIRPPTGRLDRNRA